jgi:hypothetical protein
MSDVLSPDAALAVGIERLKVAFPKTRELYREVCALLFFRHGITPTANRQPSVSVGAAGQHGHADCSARRILGGTARKEPGTALSTWRA